MDRGPLIFLGALLTFVSAWFAIVFAPFLQLNNLESIVKEGDPPYPRPLGGEALAGVEVYKANGCVYCHSQQIRPKRFVEADESRSGGRRTVARDYIYDKPILIGSMRTGPDLTNIGVKLPGVEGQTWHHIHLYNPRAAVKGSIMPAFRFLYEWRKVVGQPLSDPLQVALDKDERWPKREGEQLVPTQNARALVAYLQALDRTFPLPEAEDP